jgi:hypothetical protein
MWFSVAFAAAIEIVAGLEFAQMKTHAQRWIRQRELVKRFSDARLGAIDAPNPGLTPNWASAERLQKGQGAARV